MSDIEAIAGLRSLWTRTRGDDAITVAVVDGPVDSSHPAFAGARLERARGAWPDEPCDGPLGRHGTQVASVLAGQHGSCVAGVAPGCRVLSSPGFSDRRRRNSQLDLARAIEACVEAGAHVINVSGGELTSSGAASDLLDRAAQLCAQRNVLIVAAAGNDGCFCEHVPAALPTVLAVGALDERGRPLASSNFGPAYADSGLLAPGENILTAVPGGGTARASGTSFATPIVAGVAALLLSLQRRAGRTPDPLAVRDALLAGADRCTLGDERACERFLTGTLNIERAVRVVMGDLTETIEVTAACGCDGDACTCERQDEPAQRALDDGHAAEVAAAELPAAPASELVPAGGGDDDAWAPPAVMAADGAGARAAGVVASTDWQPYVYALGILGYDFGTEARRDSFKQLMAPADVGGTVVPANPYDSRQMVDHLTANPSEARALIWTLNLELTPIYAVEAVGPYAANVYDLLTRLLAGEVADQADASYIERVSIPGRRTDRTVKLFSGQAVPVVEVDQIRGLYGWQINALLGSATDAARTVRAEATAEEVGDSLREFLTRVYYDLRNLGATSSDRALNFAATNAFQAAQTFATAIAAGMSLDTIGVEKSPFCRMDSDCWDVRLRFFDPENSRRARRVFRFTIDVSDLLPVTLGDVRSWSEAG